MFQQYLQSLDGMVMYQIISFVLFIAVFTGVLVWVLRLKRDDMDRMAGMPLDDATTSNGPAHEVRS